MAKTQTTATETTINHLALEFLFIGTYSTVSLVR
jgi:hypothetical protein